MVKILVLADDMTTPLTREIVAALKPHANVIFLGGEHDERMVQECDLCVIVNAYTNGATLKIAELLMNLNKTIIAFPSDPWKYSGKGTNFLIQTGNAQPVTSLEDVLANLPDFKQVNEH